MKSCIEKIQVGDILTIMISDHYGWIERGKVYWPHKKRNFLLIGTTRSSNGKLIYILGSNDRQDYFPKLMDSKKAKLGIISDFAYHCEFISPDLIHKITKAKK